MSGIQMSYSKLGNTYPMDFIKEMDGQYHDELKVLRQKKYNKFCFDCNDAPANWTSINLGIFICENCAQIHRGIGTHISKVKSTMGSYLWHPDEMEQIKKMGNKNCKNIYPCDMIKPDKYSDSEYKKEYIIKKYSV